MLYPARCTLSFGGEGRRLRPARCNLRADQTQPANPASKPASLGPVRRLSAQYSVPSIPSLPQPGQLLVGGTNGGKWVLASLVIGLWITYLPTWVVCSIRSSPAPSPSPSSFPLLFLEPPSLAIAPALEPCRPSAPRFFCGLSVVAILWSTPPCTAPTSS